MCKLLKFEHCYEENINNDNNNTRERTDWNLFKENSRYFYFNFDNDIVKMHLNINNLLSQI